jgi:16S rRNA (cytosine967-C5)-methyltransferase
VTYATCSPVLDETKGVVEAILAARDDVELLPVATNVLEGAGPLPGTLQLWPHRHGTDAMFVSWLRVRATPRPA